MAILAGWRSTALAVITFLTTLIPPIKTWIEANTILNVETILSLVVTCYLAVIARR